jgi:hypothetical protein
VLVRLVDDSERSPGVLHRLALHFMPKATYTAKGLDETTWDAFAALVERNSGGFGGCWCPGFHPRGGRLLDHKNAEPRP